MKFNKLTGRSMLKKMKGATITGLRIYRGVFALKVFTLDTVLKVLDHEYQPLGEKPHTPAIKETKEIMETKKMKKSNGFAVFVFFAAVCTALAAVVCYLYKKEKELDDYEDMLFSEEYLEGYMPDETCDCDAQADTADCGCAGSAKEEPTF